MAPADDGETAEAPADRGSGHVYCPECGAKAAADWSFCRNCRAPLDDAEPVDRDLVVRNDGEEVDLSEFVGEPSGCRKCDNMDAAVEDLSISDSGAARLLDIENRRFRSVSCTRCGYTEFYRGRAPNEALALFLR
ncbi:MAG: zinc ribbon domain-containing protein [Halobacteriales archaeon]